MTKYCPRCTTDKDVGEFFKNGSSKDGLQGYCKPCWQSYLGALPNRMENERKRHLRRWYGMTIEEYDALFAAQQGRCAICKEQPPVLCVDHSHETGEVRGLLCGNCNHLLGKAKDSVVILQAAIEYLK